MDWERIGYAALCIIGPVAWGLTVYKFSDIIERRVLRRQHSTTVSDEEPPMLPLDYHI